MITETSSHRDPILLFLSANPMSTTAQVARATGLGSQRAGGYLRGMYASNRIARKKTVEKLMMWYVPEREQSRASN